MNEMHIPEALDTATELAGQAVDFFRSKVEQEAGKRIWKFSLEKAVSDRGSTSCWFTRSAGETDRYSWAGGLQNPPRFGTWAVL